ncbi:O-methyltransferase family protein [Sclerotinia borealis F-4128]|uniref:O-methyltransferase family protein n=1 Tax=Sclerotinia borealis (strain F-4128) TaxID=1432307 RepID=W9CWG1_SCLBF|nr:O-methyltransferase family protein [Sclerotinia borealis F-4128]
MDCLAKLERYSNELALAVKSLATHSRGTNAQLFTDLEAAPEVQQAKQNVLLNVAKIKTLVLEPTDFLKHLASQGGILGCLRWLGEFQILACIPLTGSVPMKDVADLSRVSERQLSRVVHLVASAGFLQLQGSQPMQHVVHTALSASFVTSPSLLDAAMFLAEYAAPAVLQTQSSTLMLTQKNVANQSPKLQRQLSAYLTYAGGLDTEDSVVDNLMQLNWAKIGSSVTPTAVHVVEVGAESTITARSLTALNPILHFHMQLDAPKDRDHHMERQREEVFERELGTSEPRITITHRPIGVGCPQITTDAAVYILHLPETPLAILAELKEHFGILRAGNAVMLILTARLLPESGSIPDTEAEVTARARELASLNLQLTTTGAMEMVELFEMIETISDNLGKLVVMNKLRSRNNIVVALAVKYVDHGLDLWSGTGSRNGDGDGIYYGLGGLATENSQ